MAHVTIENTPSFVRYDVTSSDDGPFTVPFAIFSEDDLVVEVDGEDIGSAFSYVATSSTTGGYQTGEVTLDVAVANAEVLIYRNLSPVRTTDYAPGPVARDALNSALDRVQAQLQDVKRDLDSALKLTVGENADRFPASATRAGKIIVFNDDGEPIAGAVTDITTALVNAAWTTALGKSPENALADLNSVYVEDDIAALRLKSWVAADAPPVVSLKSCYVDGDPGGIYRFDSSDTTSADNDGTIIVTASGRRYKLVTSGAVFISQFGADMTGGTSSTAAFNKWVAEAFAHRAPATLLIDDGILNLATEPNDVEDIAGASIIGAGISRTTVLASYDGASRENSVFTLKGASGGGVVGNFTVKTADGYEGGSGVQLLAKTATAPDATLLFNIYGSSNTATTAKTITAISNAAQGVFTATGHGLQAGDRVVLVGLAGGTFGAALNYGQFTVAPSPTADTFKLYVVGTSNYVDTSTYGTYTSSSGTVRRAECFDCDIRINGDARTSAPAGIRGTTILNCQLFGGREASIYATTYVGLTVMGRAISSAGWNARLYLSGVVGNPGAYANLMVETVHGLNMDRAVYTNVFGLIDGDVTDTSNTVEFHSYGDISGTYTALGAYCSTPSFFRLPNGLARQYISATGLSGTPATKSWPVPFITAPINYGSYPYSTILTSPTTTGIDAADSSSSTSRIWAEGYV